MIQVDYTPDRDKVVSVTVALIDTDQGLALGTAGTILERYGAPCRIALNASMIASWFTLIYPGLDVDVAGGSQFNLAGYRLQATSPVLDIRLIQHTAYWTCDAPQTQDMGLWHGFIDANKYQDYFLRDANLSAKP